MKTRHDTAWLVALMAAACTFLTSGCGTTTRVIRGTIPEEMRETEDDHTLEAVEFLNVLVKAEVELENVLGIERRRHYPPEKGINEGDVVELAEKHAQELRDWLGLGAGPIGDIFSVIELDLPMRHLSEIIIRLNSIHLKDMLRVSQIPGLKHQWARFILILI